MSEKPSSSRNAAPGSSSQSRLKLLPIVLWLFAAWSFARYGIGLLAYLRAELLFNMRTDLVNRDFVNYWVGGKLVRSGHPSLLFDHEHYYDVLKLMFGNDFQIHSWSYPPHFLLVVAPLGWLDYLPALLAFLAVTFALFAWGTYEFVRRFAADVGGPRVWLALAGFVLAMIDATQNGFLTSAMVLFAFAFMRDRPALAGFALALLTMKPQLGFLVPLLALFDRNWALLRWTVLFTLGLLAVSLLMFGTQPWIGYFEDVIPYQQVVMTQWEGGFLWIMPSLFGSGRVLGLAPSTALAAHGIFAVLVLIMLLRLLARLRDPLERVFAVLAATFLVTPYSFSYDMGAFCVVAACLAWRAYAAGATARVWIFALSATLPSYMPLLAWKSVPASPLLIAAAIAVLWFAPREAGAPAFSAPS